MDRLEKFRASYAQLIVAIARLPAGETRLIAAFAAVPRERFIGPAPWQVVAATGYVNVATDDPAFLYQDFAVALKPDRHINNGQPSLHARCLAALQIRPGDTIIHVGAGTGYYSALLETLTGPNGSVLAYEVDQELAEKATANLSPYPNVTVRNCSGVEGSLPESDVIYASAGTTAPLEVWLNALRPGGRLLFPLTTAQGFGAMLLVTRTISNDIFAARFICQAAFIHCIGARDEKTAQKLIDAFKTGGLLNWERKGGVWDVKSLRRNTPPDATCWFGGNGWWLSTRPPPANAVNS